MTEELLIGLTVLSIINIALHFRKKSDKTGQDERLKSIENAIIKFDSSLEKNEKSSNSRNIILRGSVSS